MRICIVEPEPSYGGGSEKICLDLARGFAGTDDVYLIYSTAGTMLPEYQAICQDIRQTQISPFGWRSILRSLRSAASLRHQFSQWGIEGVLCSNIHFIRTLALAVLGTRVRVVYHLGLAATHPMASRRAAFKLMHMGIAPSAPTMKTWADDGWPADHLCVVPNWVDAERFRPVVDRIALRRELGLPADAPVLCFVGRLVEAKGIRTLLQAFSQVLRTHRDCLLVCVGTSPDGSKEPWAGLARELSIADRNLKWVGRDANPERYLAAADAGLAPSECEESFGLVVLEAMACGTPPIVTEVGVLREIVGPDGEGLVCQPCDAGSLADAIHALLTMPAERRAQLGRALRQRAIERFSFEPGFREYKKHLEAGSLAEGEGLRRAASISRASSSVSRQPSREAAR